MKKRKTILTGLLSIVAVAALVFGMVGCSDGSSDDSSPKSNKNKNEDGTYFDNGETFCRGVWAVDNGEKRVGYYIFFDVENGKFCDAQLGMNVPFAVKVKKNAADFSLGASDFTDPTTVEKSGEGKRILTWTNENRVEYLTLLGDQEPDQFSYYSQNDLSEMAMDYYEIEKGVRPETAGISIDVDGVASIQLWNNVGGNGDVIAEYEVDSITGKGTVKGKDEEIVLIKRSTDD